MDENHQGEKVNMTAVVVTGGGSPLGKELTERFLSQGLDVISIVRPHNISETPF